MKNILCILVAIIIVGCSTSQVTTAYKTETAVDTSITTAWSLWQAYLQANPTTSIATRQQIAAAFNKVKAAELVAIDATTLAASTSTTNGVSLSLTNETQALSDLSNLLAQFNIKL